MPGTSAEAASTSTNAIASPDAAHRSPVHYKTLTAAMIDSRDFAAKRKAEIEPRYN